MPWCSYNSNSTVVDRYVHGSNAAADDPLVWYDGNGLNTKRWLHADHLGSIVGITDQNGHSFAINSYDEYGINGIGNETGGRFGYTGQAFIPELGMYYYKARIYSPTLGRFLQTDPIGYEDQINLYTYVGNDPVNHTDPTGMQDMSSYYRGWEKVAADNGETLPDFAEKMDRKSGAFAIGVSILPVGGVLTKGVSRIGRALGIGERAAPALSRATRMAQRGERYTGELRQALAKTDAQLGRTIRNSEARASEHLGYLRDPVKAVEEKGGNWSNMTQQARDGLVSYWRKEAQNYQAQADIARDVLTLRGQ